MSPAASTSSFSKCGSGRKPTRCGSSAFEMSKIERPFHVETYMWLPTKRALAAPAVSGSFVTSWTLSEWKGAAEAGAAAMRASTTPSAQARVTRFTFRERGVLRRTDASEHDTEARRVVTTRAYEAFWRRRDARAVG